MTGGDLLLKCLAAQGVRALFGMPGTQNLPIYDALYRAGSGVAHYLIRHEQNATLIANGYARASGRVGVAVTVPGPGATNASTGIGDAYTDCVPVLLVTGGYTRALAGRARSKMFHGLDQEALFASITRYFGCPQRPEEIPPMVEAAFAAMLSGRPGPAVLEIAPDLAQQECDSRLEPAAAVRPGRGPAPEAQRVAQAAERITGWNRPAILVGQDVVHSQASGAVLQLAELLEAPIVFSRLGKGAVDDRHRLVVGDCRSPQARTLREAADGWLAVGVRFTQIDTLGWKDRFPSELIQIDRDPGELGREYPVALGIAADLSAALESLCGALQQPSRAVEPNTEWTARVTELTRAREARAAVPVLSQIRQGLPDDGILAVDVTSLGYRAFDEFPVPGPRQFLYPCHYVTLGFGFPAALGAKIAAPERPVVALCGDGGFLMTAMDLALAVEREVPLVSVVVADGCLTAIKGSQLKHYEGRAIATDMHVPDFVALARAFGAHGVRVERLDELPQLVDQGIRRRGPTVIEVPMREQVDEIIETIPWLIDR